MKSLKFALAVVATYIGSQSWANLPTEYSSVKVSNALELRLKKQVCSPVAKSFAFAYRQTIVNVAECEQSGSILLGKNRKTGEELLVLQAPAYYGRRTISFYLKGSFDSRALVFAIESMSSDLGSE